MAAAAPDTRNGISFDLVIQIVGAGAALAAWVEVIGGARVWARFYTAGIPASTSVALQSREYLFIEGVRWLLPPLLLGAAAAAWVYFTYQPAVPPPLPGDDFEVSFQKWRLTPQARQTTIDWWQRDVAKRAREPLDDFLHHSFAAKEVSAKEDVTRRERAKEVGKFIGNDQAARLLVLGFVAMIAIVIVGDIRPWEALAIVLSTAFAIFVVVRTLVRSETKRARAVRFFLVVAVWSGALGFLWLMGEQHPRFDLALVTRSKPHVPAVGFFVARTDGNIYVAERIGHGGYRVVMVPEKDVLCFSYGPSRAADESDSRSELLSAFTAVGLVTCPARNS